PQSALAGRRADASVSATIVDVHTSRPLAGAHVSAYGASARPFEQATSGSNGEVTLKDLEVGQYRLRIEKPGYQTMAYTLEVRSHERDQSAGRLVLYPVGDRALPRSVSGVECGHPMRPDRTANVYVVCSGG
ncbi:MAG TPA: carboxypeptidase-like regulatory domain-containing protein, partial [Candidatus Dormibacteraeota bacterium]|nr:carboxypeptidase-like regulatory domain-containing protein [Candidatus Dormibacteraeota bacterium]